MTDINLQCTIHKYSFEELDKTDQDLIRKAMKATDNSYAPYSGFSVGAAVLMDNGRVYLGANQENAAYPSGLCA
ncbi:MAG: cytidine deaminase, partial [Prevotella sp.]|nr:cytidine deaminase [Candidatus Equicola stercoris]